MASGARHRVHATWHANTVCLWSWDPVGRRPIAPWADRGARGAGPTSTVTLLLPERGRVEVGCIRWPLAAVVDSWVGRPVPAGSSDSVRWCHDAVALAAVAAGSDRAVPALASDGTSRWRLAFDDELLERVALLTASMPPVVAAAGPVDVADLLERAADAASRSGLRALRWRPAPTGRRTPPARAVRSMFASLATPALSLPPVLGSAGAGDDDPAVQRALRTWLDDERRRRAGQPLVRFRLRMVPAAIPDEPWEFGLEVVSASDESRWCEAAELLESTPGAIGVSGHARHLAGLAARARDVAAAVADAVADLAPVAEEPFRAELDVIGVGRVLEHAERLESLGVELLGPEELLRATARVSASVAAPAGGVAGGLELKAMVSWKATVDGQDVSEEDLAAAVAAGAALMHIGGRWVRLEAAQIRQVLGALGHHRAHHGEVTPATLLRLVAGVDDAAVPDVVGQGWAAELLAGLPDDRLVEAHEPDGFTGELRHYQRRGLAWLGFLSRLGLGGCLADDMGLGKTATTLAHLLGRPGPHLVVCPLSVVRNWEQEAARFAPGLRVTVHHGAERAQGVEAADALAGHDVVLTTYGLLARELPTFAAVAWSTLVLDEAQAVKNPNTKAAKAVRKVPAAQRIALTGTPVENRLTELWAVLDAVNPGLLGPLSRFSATFATPIERHRDDDAADRLRRLTRPFLLRRTKADKSLVPELPDKVEQIAWAPLTKEQAALYQGVVDQLLADAASESGMRRRGLVLAALTRLKQICNHPAQALGDGSRLAGRSGKLARFDELVDELLDAGERALVFTQYREMGELLVRHLGDLHGFSVPFLHGGVARAGRDRMVSRFQAGEGPPLLLVSLKAGGTGLNLTSASRVIHYDRWWNPAVEDQATDRAWRIGQHQTVFVHKLVCSGTLEERIAQLIDDKRALAATVVGTSGEAWLSELSTDELRDLVTLREVGS